MSIKVNDIIFLFCLLLSIEVNGQSNQSITQRLLKADSVILISYANPAGKGDRKDILNGKMNLHLLKEYKVISRSKLEMLGSILSRPFQDVRVEEMGCFEPHHTIYILKGNKISFISICFLCEEIVTSKDISFQENDFDKLTWKQLKLFFSNQGFKYSLNKMD